MHLFFVVENAYDRTKPPPVVSIVGRSKSGKTTLIEKLIPLLKARGYRVGTVKHHAHPGFDIDIPGKDTWRHAQAGSDHVVIAAPDKIASIVMLQAPLDLPQILAGMQDVDIVLTDGYRRANNPKLKSCALLCQPSCCAILPS
jgi:molybdopterin-guanine dinucleotide biosynthesis protein MobB